MPQALSSFAASVLLVAACGLAAEALGSMTEPSDKPAVLRVAQARAAAPACCTTTEPSQE
jgi:hypothetical protein